MDESSVLKNTLKKLEERHGDNPASVPLKQILTDKLEKLEKQKETDASLEQDEGASFQR